MVYIIGSSAQQPCQATRNTPLTPTTFLVSMTTGTGKEANLGIVHMDLSLEYKNALQLSIHAIRHGGNIRGRGAKLYRSVAEKLGATYDYDWDVSMTGHLEGLIDIRYNS